jgi:hypothetical protein
MSFRIGLKSPVSTLLFRCALLKLWVTVTVCAAATPDSAANKTKYAAIAMKPNLKSRVVSPNRLRPFWRIRIK